MKLGVHTSIAGGLYKALLRGQEIGCDVVQIFTTNPNQWTPRQLTTEDIRRFKDTVTQTDVVPVMSHASYLINLASPQSEQRGKSVSAFHAELERAEALEIPYVVSHPGSHLGTGEQEGLERVVKSIAEVIRRSKGFRTAILLETTSGQGACLGNRFEHFRTIFHRIREPERIGICLDTCHLFAAGYDIRRVRACRRTLELFDRIIGLDRLKAVHLNDSKTPLGSRVDRHEHIGKGEIGLQGFRCLLKDSRLGRLPMVLETPKGKGNAYDKKNLAVLRRLVE